MSVDESAVKTAAARDGEEPSGWQAVTAAAPPPLHPPRRPSRSRRWAMFTFTCVLVAASLGLAMWSMSALGVEQWQYGFAGLLAAVVGGALAGTAWAWEVRRDAYDKQVATEAHVEDIAREGLIVVPLIDGQRRRGWRRIYLGRRPTVLADGDLAMERAPVALQPRFISRMALFVLILVGLVFGAVYWSAGSAGNSADEAAIAADRSAAESVGGRMPRSEAELCTSLFYTSTKKDSAAFDALCMEGVPFAERASGRVSAVSEAFAYPVSKPLASSSALPKGGWRVVVRSFVSERRLNEDGSTSSLPVQVRCSQTVLQRAPASDTYVLYDVPAPVSCPDPGVGDVEKGGPLRKTSEGREPWVSQAVEYLKAYATGESVERFMDPEPGPDGRVIQGVSLPPGLYTSAQLKSASFGDESDGHYTVRVVMTLVSAGGIKSDVPFVLAMSNGPGGLWYVSGRNAVAEGS